MSTTKRPWLVPAALTLGALLIAGRWWLRRMADDEPAPLGTVAIATVATLAFGVAVAALFAHRSRALHDAVRRSRPQHRLAGGWSDASLGAELARVGVLERLRPQGGVRLVLAWSRGGLELWRDGGAGSGGRKPMLSVGWDEVEDVFLGEGIAAALPRPAVVVRLRASADLVVVPCRREAGGLLPATRVQAAALASELGAQVAAGSSADSTAARADRPLPWADN